MAGFSDFSVSSPMLSGSETDQESLRQKQNRYGIYHVYYSDEEGYISHDFFNNSVSGVRLDTPPMILVESGPECSPVMRPKIASPKKRMAPQPPVTRSSDFLTPVLLRRFGKESFRSHSHEDLRKYEEDSSNTSLSVSNSPAFRNKLRNKLKFALRSPRIKRRNSKKRTKDEQDSPRKNTGFLPDPNEWLLALVPEQMDSDTEFEVGLANFM